MAYALVGTKGTVSTGASGASVTPAWGTSETRTTGNLLILWVASNGSATLPAAISGWTIAKQFAGSSTSSSIYYKIAAGSDAAPTVAAVTSSVISAQLAEFSGGSGVLDQTGGASGASGTTATCGAVDAATGDLVIVAASILMSTAETYTDAITSNNATMTTTTTSTSTVDKYGFAYGVTTANSAATTGVSTMSTTTHETGEAVSIATFRLVAPSVSLINTFESGTSGNAITAGTGGDNQFTGVNGTACVYSNAQAAAGVLSMLIANPTAISQVRWWGFGSLVTDVFFGHYLYLVANPSGQIAIWQVQDAAFGNCAFLGIATDGTISMWNAAGTSIANGTVSIGLGQWVYVAGRVRASTTVGQVEFRLWNDIYIPLVVTDTASANGAVLAANCDGVGYGISVATTATVYMDNVAVSTSGWLGPQGLATPPRPVVVDTAVARASRY